MLKKMNTQEIKNIALSTFEKMLNSVKSTDQYHYSMQISTSDDDRVYIGFCHMFNINRAIIHEEYDGSNKMDNTRIVEIKFVRKIYTKHA